MSKAIFISDLTPETGLVEDVFRASQAERKMASNGKPYLALTLKDRTGEAQGRLWDAPATLDIKPGSYVKISARTESYRDALQLKVFKAQTIDRDLIAIEDFVPASTRDREAMLEELASFIELIGRKDLQHALFAALYMDRATRRLLRDCPAARKVHQAYLGGLLEHLINLCSLAVGVCSTYPDLDRDVLLAGAIVHDIGKLWELSYFEDIGTTCRGQLLGHIVQGSIWWDRISMGLDQDLRDHIAHIIASHHGQLEWGAAVEPMSREAQVFHLLDMIDSRMAIMTEALKQPVDADGFTPKVYPLGRGVWQHRQPASLPPGAPGVDASAAEEKEAA